MECFQSKWPGVVDQDVEKLAKYRRSKTARTRGHNCSRDFHRWVHRDQRAFDVKISTLKVPIRIKHKRRNGRQIIGVKKVDYPVIHLSSWFEKLINTFPQFFLGGFDLYQQEESWAGMLSNFWKNFLGVDPQHPVHLKTDAEKKRCIPIALHGDEGRGLAKVPLMIWSFQVIIPSSGPNNLNTTQQPASTQFVWCLSYF